MAAALVLTLTLLLAPVSTAAQEAAAFEDVFTSPHADGGCATGEVAVKFTFGGCSCAPACDAEGKCGVDPVGADVVHPICVLAEGGSGQASGNPSPTHCALHCNPSSRCPDGATCHMPEEVCVFPDSSSASLTSMGMTRGPTELERLWAHDDNGH
jgi:hypothetical protein